MNKKFLCILLIGIFLFSNVGNTLAKETSSILDTSTHLEIENEITFRAGGCSEWVLYKFGKSRCVGTKCGLWHNNGVHMQKEYFKRKCVSPTGEYFWEYREEDKDKGCC